MKITEKQLKETIKNEINNIIQEQKYNTLYSLVKECINETLTQEKEAEGEVSDTHFAILKSTNKIIFGWDYSGYDPSELRDFKRDYFMNDIIDLGYNPKDVKILTKRYCLKQGINPEDVSNWDNGYDYTVECSNTKKEVIKEDDDNEWDENETEELEAIDFYDFENICHSNGWDWHDSFDVNNGQQYGIRYVFAQGKGCTFEELVSQIKQKANDPNGIIAGTAKHRYAPEIKHYSIIVLFV